MRKRVLVIATSINTKGGITSVIKAYKQTELWSDWHCFWLATHIDRNKFIKICTFLSSIIRFYFLLPFYSILHIHFSEPSSALRKLLFIYSAKLFKKKIVTHFHSYSIETTINGKHQNLYREIFYSSNKIIVLSLQWKTWLINKWPEIEEKIEIIFNPCPVLYNRKITYPKYKTIIYAGILNARKGYSDLIKAFAMIAESHIDWQLVFAGNGEIEKARSLAIDYKIDNQVTFKGWVSGTRKEELFETAAIFCLPSYAEGFPMAVLDAWAYGLPVITTPVGGLPDILVDRKNALIVNPGDLVSLSEALKNLIEDTNLREKLSNESRYLSSKIFNVETISHQIDLLYNQVLTH